MVHHKDLECDAAMTRLLDALCTWERETGRGSMLIFVPNAPDEDVVLAQDGKPLPVSPGMGPKEILDIALRGRG